MNKICTSIEQSKKLIELGIDVNTADMYWWPTSLRYYIETMDDGDFNEDEGHIRAWSLTALLKLMPPYLFEFERGIDLNIYPNLNGKGWHCSYMPNTIENMKKDKFRQITNGDNLIDAAFEMVCWLLENKKDMKHCWSCAKSHICEKYSPNKKACKEHRFDNGIRSEQIKQKK